MAKMGQVCSSPPDIFFSFTLCITQSNAPFSSSVSITATEVEAALSSSPIQPSSTQRCVLTSLDVVLSVQGTAESTAPLLWAHGDNFHPYTEKCTAFVRLV